MFGLRLLVFWCYGFMICWFMVLWFYGVMVFGFMALWFYGCMVLWFYSLYGCIALCFMAFWCYRFIVLWFYGVMKISNLHFMFSRGYRSHIHDFQDLITRTFIMFRCLSFTNMSKKWMFHVFENSGLHFLKLIKKI